MNVASEKEQRKLLVSKKYFNGIYDGSKQKFGFKVSERLSEVICKFVWSPIIFKDGVRVGQNFIESHWCALDFDGSMDIDQACKVFIDYQYLIAPTKSHSETHHCFRVCIPWERPILDFHEYRWNMERIITVSGADECKDAARFFWPSTSIYRMNIDGERMEVRKAPERIIYPEAPRPKRPMMPGWLLKLCEATYTEGGRNQALFNIACALWRNGHGQEGIRQIIRGVSCEPCLSEREFAEIERKYLRACKAQIQ